MRLVVGLLLVAAHACGCAARIPLRREAASVAIATAAASGCVRLREVLVTQDMEGVTLEQALRSARNGLRNDAQALGANLVVLETTVTRGIELVLVGQAYRCPAPEASPSTPTP